MSDFITAINDVVWAMPLVYLCLLAGVYFTIRTRFLQIRMVPDMVRQMFAGKSSEDGVSSYQALAMSLAGRVGTGNIAGVATAIAFGGPGAVFWMWTMAVLGASSSFIECTLGQIYKERDKDTGEYRGGPAFYLEKAYRHTKAKGLFKVYASAFAFVTVLAMTFLLPGVQANSMAAAMTGAWGTSPWVVGLVTVVLLGFIIIGGVKRIANFASVVVPFMAILYIIAAIIVVFVNIDLLGEVISLIFSSAFGVHATLGAVIGAAVEWGVKRGIYSNEAGQGTGPHAASAAEVSHPAKQGLVQAGAVYIDTLFVCSATAFMIISTGMYKVFPGADPEADPIFQGAGTLPDGAEPGPMYPQSAFDTILPGLGSTFVAITLAFFVFTTIVAYYYMAETNLKYLMRDVKSPMGRNVALRVLQILFLGAVVFGATTNASDAWTLGDIGVGLMAWLNVVGILLLQQPAMKALKDYEAQRKAGRDPVFDPDALGIKNAELWNELDHGIAERPADAARR